MANFKAAKLIEIAEFADVWCKIESFIEYRSSDQLWNAEQSKHDRWKLRTLYLLNKQWNAFIKSNLKYINLMLLYPESGHDNSMSTAIDKALSSFKFTGLEYINLRETHLESMPDPLMECKNVKFLDLSENEIGDTLDDKYFKLWGNSMIYLYLEGIRLHKLPENIKLLTKLKILSIRNNHLNDIPIECIKPLKNLQIFRYDFNPLLNFPISLPSISVSMASTNQWQVPRPKITFNPAMDRILNTYFYQGKIPKIDIIENPEKYKLNAPINASPNGRHLKFRHQNEYQRYYHRRPRSVSNDEENEENKKETERKRLRGIEEQKSIECYFENNNKELIDIMSDIAVRYLWNKMKDWTRYQGYEGCSGWNTPKLKRYRIEAQQLCGHYCRRFDDIPTIKDIVIGKEEKEKEGNYRIIKFFYYLSGVHSSSWNGRGRWHDHLCSVKIDIDTYKIVELEKPIEIDSQYEPR